MSYLISIIKRINALLNKKTKKFSDKINTAIEFSKLNKTLTCFSEKVKQSYIFSWLMKPEKEIDVFETSKVTNKVIDAGSEIINKGEQYTTKSSIFMIGKTFRDEFTTKPIFSISLIVFVATITNSILWLSFRDFEINGLIIRIIIIILSIIGLKIKSEKILNSSIIAKSIKKLE